MKRKSTWQQKNQVLLKYVVSIGVGLWEYLVPSLWLRRNTEFGNLDHCVKQSSKNKVEIMETRIKTALGVEILGKIFVYQQWLYVKKQSMEFNSFS